MTRLTQHATANAPSQSQPLLEQVESSLGFVPNLYATFAESPAVLGGYIALDASLAKGALSAVERQLVEIAVSVENDCAYCVAAHSTLANMVKARPEVVTAVRTGSPIGDRKLDALLTFTRLVMRTKGFVSDTEIGSFLTAGYTTAQLLEVVAHVGLKTIANYVNAIAETPLDAAFEPQQWDPTQVRVA
jgi:uncharacterized peroxidase-related enzyme